MLTPQRLVGILRLAAVVGGVGLTVLLLGPFQGLERHLGLNDTTAHALAFYAVTVGLFAIAPHHRRLDLALAALAFGVVIEIVQGAIGRSLSLLDLASDGTGILAALLPGLVERLRHLIRVAPDQSFGSLRALDRRRPTPALVEAADRQTLAPPRDRPPEPAVRDTVMARNGSNAA